jgi:hypothetical protein
MNEELVKAEGQIELIKDLLLREQGFDAEKSSLKNVLKSAF